FLNRTIALDRDCSPKDVVECLRRDAKAVIGAFEEFPGTTGHVGNFAGRLVVQFFPGGIVFKLLGDEQADLFDGGLLALEVTLDGGIEDALHAAQVLTYLLNLFRNSEKEVHVLFFVAPEIMDADIPDLPVAGDTTVPLLQL